MCLCFRVTKRWDRDVTNATVEITLQYINVSNQHTVHAKLIQCYMLSISQLSWKNMS